MNPTTAADRTLVTSSIASSLDWMLIRDSTRRRRLLGLGAGSGGGGLSVSVVSVVDVI